VGLLARQRGTLERLSRSPRRWRARLHKWRCCAMLAITRALHSTAKRYKGTCAVSFVLALRSLRSRCAAVGSCWLHTSRLAHEQRQEQRPLAGRESRPERCRRRRASQRARPSSARVRECASARYCAILRDIAQYCAILGDIRRYSAIIHDTPKISARLGVSTALPRTAPARAKFPEWVIPQIARAVSKYTQSRWG